MTLEEWAASEQEALWNDLDSALRYAFDGHWSIQAEGVTERLIAAMRLMPPTPFSGVPWTLLAGGVYEAVVRKAGAPLVLPTESEWPDLDRVMAQYGGARADLRERWRRTVETITASRDLAGA